MPLPITETGVPLYSPVKPSMPRTALTRRTFSRQVSAMCCARSGSPGHEDGLGKIARSGFDVRSGSGHVRIAG